MTVSFIGTKEIFLPHQFLWDSGNVCYSICTYNREREISSQWLCFNFPCLIRNVITIRMKCHLGVFSQWSFLCECTIVLTKFFCLIVLYLCICIGEFYLTYIYLSNHLKISQFWSICETLGSSFGALPSFHLYCTLWINRAFYICIIYIYNAWIILVITEIESSILKV